MRFYFLSYLICSTNLVKEALDKYDVEHWGEPKKIGDHYFNLLHAYCNDWWGFCSIKRIHADDTEYTNKEVIIRFVNFVYEWLKMAWFWLSLILLVLFVLFGGEFDFHISFEKINIMVTIHPKK